MDLTTFLTAVNDPSVSSATDVVVKYANGQIVRGMSPGSYFKINKAYLEGTRLIIEIIE